MQHYKLDPQTLKLELTKIKQYNFRTMGLIAIFLVILGFSSAIKVNTIIEKVPVFIEHKEEPCNDETVKAYIKTLNLRFPQIVYQQVCLESNYLQSPMVRDLNNLVCMEVASIRPTLGINIGQRFAKYNSWKECLGDYAIWQSYVAKEVRNEDEYYELLDKVYCPYNLEENKGPLYSTRLKQISK